MLLLFLLLSAVSTNIIGPLPPKFMLFKICHFPNLISNSSIMSYVKAFFRENSILY